jgi:hypothetical protein
MAKTTITVSFAAAEGTDTTLLKLVLDSDSGSLVHNQMVCVRMYRNPMTMQAQPSISRGRVTRQGLRREQITETVTFAIPTRPVCPARPRKSSRINGSVVPWRSAPGHAGDRDLRCGGLRRGPDHLRNVYESLGVYVPRAGRPPARDGRGGLRLGRRSDSAQTITAALALHSR